MISKRLAIILSFIGFSFASFSQAGPGKSLKFNGTTQFVDCGTINLSGTAITLQGWVKVTAFKTTFPYISSFIGTEQPSSQAAIRFGDATIPNNKAQFVLQFGTSFSKLTSNTTFAPNIWYHIAATYDGTTMKLYVNGILDGSLPASGSFSSNDIFEIARNYGNDRILNGEVDEISVFKSALSETTIRDWMCKKITVTHPNYSTLNGYWPLNEGTGITTADASPYSNNGTLTATPLWFNSSAPIGDDSKYVYATSGINLGISHPNGDSLNIATTSGTFVGMHVYRVDSVPNETTPPAGIQYLDTTRYWGVFPIGTANYTVTYDYNGNPNVPGNECLLNVAKRTNNSVTPWVLQSSPNINYTAQTITFSGNGQNELILCFGNGAAHVYNFNIDEPTCFGQNDGMAHLTVSNGLAPYTYSWSTGSTADSSGNVSSGKVYVTVTDGNGCVSNDSVQVTQPDSMYSLANNIPSLCNDTNTGALNSVNFGGTTPYTYQWNNPSNSTTANISGLYPGNYTLTLTDVNGCTGITVFTVNSTGPEPMPYLGNDTSICEGVNYQLGVSGGLFTDYNWSTGASGPVIGITQSGNYSVTVTNTAGCTSDTSINIVFVTPVQVNLPSTASGVNQVTLDAGSGFSSYQWNTGATTQTLVVSQSGLYWVNTKDDNGCRSADTTQVTIGPNGINIISNNGISIYPNPAQNDLNVSASNGSIVEVLILDLTGKIVLRSENESSINITEIPSGLYFLKVSTSDLKVQTFKIQKN